MNRTSENNYRVDAALQQFSQNFAQVLCEKGIEPEAEAVLYRWQVYNPNVMVSPAAVHNWLIGKYLPRYTTVLALADWLDCEASDLLPRHLQDLLKGFASA